MNSQDWQDMARVYRAGAARNRRWSMNTGCQQDAQVYEAMADECDAIAAERASPTRTEIITPEQAVAAARWMGYSNDNVYLDRGAFVWQGDPGMVGGTMPMRSDQPYECSRLLPDDLGEAEISFGNGQCTLTAPRTSTDLWQLIEGESK
jgi:hypothetical protein